MKKLLFLVNVDWFFISHRLPIAQAAQKQGYEVHIATHITDRYEALSAYGFIVHPLPAFRGHTGIVNELNIFYRVWQTVKNIKPDILHTITIKPVLYGGIVARCTRIKRMVVTISGLGYLFTTDKPSILLQRKLVSWLYRLVFKHRPIKVIFQNHDDKAIITKFTGLDDTKTAIIPGSGVNLKAFVSAPEPKRKTIKVVMASRLLVDKGIHEFVAAAQQLQNKGIKATFQLAGAVDPGNPTSITPSQIETWQRQGIVELLGRHSDIATLFSQAHIVVLPSYREGFPKVLIEAAACGRPIVTTDVTGCRDAIIPDKTGLLVPPRDVTALTDAIEHLILNPELRQSMGQAGRQLAEEKYDIRQVIETHLNIYQALLND